jgi:APA family basic amino acid/polyamine antiporter
MSKDSSSPGLIRALGPWMATAVVVGTVIGSGVYMKAPNIARAVPYSGVALLIWVVGGVLVLLGALTYAEVAVLYPKAGGNYVFLREAYGRPVGFLWGWVDFWVVRGASLAALATVFTSSFHEVLSNEEFQQAVGLPIGTHLGYWSQRAMTVTVLIALALVNVRGVRWGGGLQFLITLVKVGSLIAIALLPFVLLACQAPAAAEVQTEKLDPIWPTSLEGVTFGGLSTALLAVLWAYHGWMNIGPVAEEIRQPQRNIPLALLLGVCILVALYLGANLAYYLVVPRAEMLDLGKTNIPVATPFGLKLIGPLGAAAASAAVMCSVFGALNGNLLVGPRVLYAMGEDGLAPPALREVHARYRTPALAICVMAGWACVLVVGVALLTQLGALSAAKSHFDRLTDFAMFGAIIFETMAVASVFVFRRIHPEAERPYRCWGYPVVPLLYVILPIFVLSNMFLDQPVEAFVGLAFIAMGVAVYVLVERRRAR